MVSLRTKPLLIDCCALGLLFEPRLFKFWKGFDPELRHCTSTVVYWEFLRGCGPRSNRKPNREQFLHWAKNKATLLPFGTKEADYACAIYKALDLKWRHLEKTEKRQRLVKVHADIMIAATAVQQGLQVLTEDVEDWGDIAAVIKEDRIGALGGFSVLDPEDIAC